MVTGGLLLVSGIAHPEISPIVALPGTALTGLGGAEAVDGLRGMLSAIDGKERPGVFEQVGGLLGGEEGEKAGKVASLVFTVRGGVEALMSGKSGAGEVADAVRPLLEDDPDSE